MNTRNNFRGGGGGVKAAGVQKEQTYHLHETIALKFGNPQFLETPQFVTGLYTESSRHGLLNLSGTRGRTQTWRNVDQALIGGEKKSVFVTSNLRKRPSVF